MKISRLLLFGLLLLAFPASAQVNRVPQLGVVDNQGATYVDSGGLKNTYSATAIGLAPGATATDIACLTGSSSKVVKLTKISLSGTSSTLVTVPVKITKNASVDSGGTNGSSGAAPVAYALNSTFSAATATATSYTASPTVNDSTPGIIDAAAVTFPITSSAVAVTTRVFEWGLRGGESQPTLNSTAQQICVNLNSTSVAAGLLNISFTWTEE